MNGFLTVARRELWERRNLVLAAPILALLPLLAPYVPGLTDVPEGVRRLAFKALLGFALPLALALGLGASALGDEVAGRRLGFFFSRPLGTFAIWGGKMVVALLVPVAISVLVVGPFVLFRTEGGDLAWRGFRSMPWFVILGFSWVLASLAQVVAGLYRTRSPWLVLDLALAGALSTAFYLLVWHLVDAGAGPRHTNLGPDSPPLWIATLYLVGICLAAGYRPGRGGPHRSPTRATGRCRSRFGAASAWGSPWPPSWAPGSSTPVPRTSASAPSCPCPGEAPSCSPGYGPVVAPSSPTSWWTFARRTGPSDHERHLRARVFPERAISSSSARESAGASPRGGERRARQAPGGHARPAGRRGRGLAGLPLRRRPAGGVREGSEARLVDTATGKRLGLPALESTMACTFEGRRELVLYTADFARRSVYRRLVDLETGAQR